MLFAPTKRIVLNPPVSRRAVALWRARNYNATLDALVDESGNGLHARLGSAVGADSNDPLRLPYNGKEVYFPGVAGNYLSATITALTGAVEVRFKNNGWLQVNGTAPIVGDRTAASGWSFYLNVGLIYFQPAIATVNQQIGGTKVVDATLAAAPWIKLVGEPNNAGNRVLTVYYSSDGNNWTQWDTNTAVGSGGAITASAGAVRVGDIPAINTATGTGRMGYLEVCNGIGGPVVGSVDATRMSEPYASFTDAQANVWTFNRSASGRKLCVVDRDLLLLGTDDYLEVPNHPLLNFLANEPYTIAVARRRYGAASGSEFIFAKKANGGSGAAGYDMSDYTDSKIYPEMSDGITQTAWGGQLYTSGVAQMVSSIRRAGVAFSAINATLSATTNVTLSPNNASVLRFGSLSGGGSYYNGELIAMAIFREALTTADLARLKLEMGVLT